MSERGDTTTPHGAARGKALELAEADYRAALGRVALERAESARLAAIVKAAENAAHTERRRRQVEAERVWDEAEQAAKEAALAARVVRKDNDRQVVQEIVSLLKADHAANHGGTPLEDCAQRTCRLVAQRERPKAADADCKGGEGCICEPILGRMSHRDIAQLAHERSASEENQR